jgi:hypothetical protein
MADSSWRKNLLKTPLNCYTVWGQNQSNITLYMNENLLLKYNFFKNRFWLIFFFEMTVLLSYQLDEYISIYFTHLKYIQFSYY